MLWVNPEKNTWRDLPAMLSFLDTTSGNNADSITCLQIQNGFKRMFQLPEETTFRFGVWCGGVKVSSNAGEQYLTGSDDAVESETFFDLNIVTSAACFDYFRQGMNRMEKGANVLYSAVSKYEKAMNNTVSQDKAKQATGLYWQMIEPSFQLFVNFCDDEDSESIEQLFTVYKRNLYAVYDQICPHGTARQFESWIKNKPIPWALQNTNKNNGG